jgi:hypothetical protein
MARSLRITHSHAKKQHNKIRNNTPIISNRNKSYTKPNTRRDEFMDIKNTKNGAKTQKI